MARIEGVDLPRNKRVAVALTYIYGIGPTRSKNILDATRVSPETRVKDLTEAEVQSLREAVGQFRVEGELRREVQLNIKRLIEIGSYRGLRHRRNLPAHGQRTRTNARTKRGPKKTVAVVVVRRRNNLWAQTGNHAAYPARAIRCGTQPGLAAAVLLRGGGAPVGAFAGMRQVRRSEEQWDVRVEVHAVGQRRSERAFRTGRRTSTPRSTTRLSR